MHQMFKHLVRETKWLKLAPIILAAWATPAAHSQTSFSTPQVLSGEWGAVTNDNTGVIPDAGNPGIAGNYPNAPLWYQWTAPADGEVQLDTIGSMGLATNRVPNYVFTNGFYRFVGYVTNVSMVKLDTLLGVYTGTDITQLTQMGANDDLFPYYQLNWTAQNIFSVDSSNAPTPVRVPLGSDYGFSLITTAAIQPVERSYYQPYWGPSGLRFNAKAGVTYYFSVDTKLPTYGFSSAYALQGPVVLNWAYHSSGVFRFASEDIDQTGVRDTNGFAMLLYQTAETESSRRWVGTINVGQNNTTLHTYYPYDAEGVLVTVTRAAGSSGRVVVGYTTMDGDTNTIKNGDLPALGGFDYLPVSGVLTFNDYEMSKTILIPIIDDFGSSFLLSQQNRNRDFFVVLTNAALDEAESPVVAQPRLDPIYSQAVVRILDVDIDPKGPSSIEVVDTNTVPSTTNYVYSLTPTNGVFNFLKKNFRVPRDVADYWGGTPITVYVTRTGTNKASETVYWRVNNYFLDKNTSDNANNYFPLQAGSDYATPDPANLGHQGLVPDFSFSDYSGTITFPGGNNVNPQPITFTVYDNGLSAFNEDFQIGLYGLDKDGNPYQEGMVAQCTVTILADDQNPPAGSVDENWNPDYGLQMAPPINTTPQNMAHPGTDPFGMGNVYGLTVLPNDKTMIVGAFDSYNGLKRKSIALLNTNGSLDTAFEPHEGVDAMSGYFINNVAYTSNGRFLISGEFTSYNGAPTPRIARLLPSGALDNSFTPGTGADATIWAMLQQPDGKILIGGDFTEFNGTNRFSLARLNTNGTLDLSFVCTNINGTVNALAIQGTNIYVGGEFTVVGQIYRNIARLSSSGALDTSFDPGVGANAAVYAIAIQTNGQVLIGGDFTEVNGSSMNHLARLNTSGSVDTTGFFIGIGADNAVWSINPQTNGIYIGGSFTSFNGTRRMGFARLYDDGTVDTTFMDTAYNQFAGLTKIYFGDPNGVVYASAVQTDGNVMIGGSFDQVGGGQFNPLIGSNSVPSNYDPNVWPEPKARDGIRNRSNIARLIGGATPGPGNISLSPDTLAGYSANKSQQFKYVSLIRTNGTLGPLSANFILNDGQAKNGVDCNYNAVGPLYWIYWEYLTGGSRMHSDGLFGQNGYVSDIFGGFWSGGVADFSQVLVGVVNNPDNSGDLSADFELANPSMCDQFYLGGQTIPLGGALGRSSAPFTLIDNNKIAGTFGFSSDTFVASATNSLISVVRSNGVYGNVTLKYSTSNGTATNNTDYVGLNNVTMTFLPNKTSNSFSVTIKNNGYIYTNPVEKTVNLSLSALSAPGAIASYGISNAVLRLINPNYQGYLTLSSTNYSAPVSSGHIDFVVQRTSGSKGNLAVNYATSDGTAINGTDYTGTTNTLTWSDGDVSPRKISIALTNNYSVGGSKQFNVTLSNPTLNGALTPGLFGFYTNATLTIVNDNSPGELQLSAPSYFVSESGTYATITVIRTVGAAGTASVNYTTTDGSAVDGLNYVATGGVLNFGPGQLSASFDVPIKDDGVQDSLPLYFNVSLSGAVNAALGSPQMAQVQILDVQSYNWPPGSTDVAFDPTTSLNGDVLALELQSDGKILAGGAFTQVGTTPKNHIARLNSDGSLDTAFLTSPSGVNGSVQSMTLQTDDRILIGGAFNQVNAINRSYVARLLPDGSLDTSFNPGSGANNNVNAVVETFIGGVRKIYVGGAFTTFNNVGYGRLVRLNNNGTVDASFSSAVGADGEIYAVAAYPTNSVFAGKLLIAGSFAHYNGVAINRIARLNADGSLDSTFNPGTAANDVVRALAIQSDGRVLLGGNFTAINGVVANHVARLNTDGSVDTAFAANLGAGVDNNVKAIVVQPDNRIVLAGLFTAHNGQSRNRITRLMPNGALDATINFGSGANGEINAALVQASDAMIVIGGGFTQYNGQAHNRIARIYGGSAISGSVVVPAGAALVQEGFNPANGIIDANENVGLLFAFRVSAGANVGNLVATLVATNGVTLPTPSSQSYGPLVVGGPSAFRLFAFKADPAYTNGQQITATFQLQDGTNQLGEVGFVYSLGVSTNTFAYTNAIVINDNTNASPYPSVINVSGLPGTVIKSSVTFTNVKHTWAADIDALLKSPDQKTTLLMANAGGSYALNGATLKFDDSAAAGLPQSSQIVSGTYKPSAFGAVAPFPAPAPAGPYGTTLAGFNGSAPNGAWSLYVMDDAALNNGVISNGWMLKLVTADPVGVPGDVAITMSASPMAVAISNTLTFIITVTNHGPSSATGVMVTNQLPANVAFVSATGTLGSAVRNGSLVSWNVGSLGTNAGAQLAIVVKTIAYATVNNSAQVYSTSVDPNPDDDSASVTIEVAPVSIPVLSGSASETNGVFQFSITGTPGASYIIQSSTNLLNWIPVYTNLSPFTFTDYSASNYPSRFYRAVSGP